MAAEDVPDHAQQDADADRWQKQQVALENAHLRRLCTDKRLRLNRTIEDEALLLPLLEPFASDALEANDVSRLVNSPRNNSSTCIAPV